MNWSRTFEALSFQMSQCPNPKALSVRENGKWISYDTQACLHARDRYSTLLLELGLKKGDKLIIVPSLARLEWILLDAGAQQLGVVVVPVHITFTREQFQHVLTECEAKVCIFLAEEDHVKFLPKDEFPGVSSYVILSGEAGIQTLSSLLEQVDSIDQELLQMMAEDVEKDDLSSIMYTSGTTGIPKGVMLTHDNICSNVKSAMTLLPFTHLKRAISFLPYSHIFERTAIYSYMVTGASLYFPGDRESILPAFREVKPHYFYSSS